MKDRFEIISRSLSKGRGFGTQEQQYGAPFLCFHRILLAFIMHTPQNFSSFVKMMLK